MAWFRFRKIYTRTQNDEKFRALSDDAKLVFLLVLIHQAMTCLGAMRATVEGLAAELGWVIARYKKAITECTDRGMLQVNAAAAFIGAPRFLRYNEPEGPNSVIKAWLAALDLIPECPERVELITRCRAYLDAQSDAFRGRIPDAIWDAFSVAIPDAIPLAISDASRIQEREREREREREKNLMSPEPGHLALAERLRDQILANKSDARVPKDLRAWADTFRLMIERDGRQPERIAEVIDWAQGDDFWRANILSADKLREKFDQLELKMGDASRSPSLTERADRAFDEVVS